MNLVSSIKSILSGSEAEPLARREPTISRPGSQSKSQRIQTTAWDAARMDNLVSGWISTPVPINQQIGCGQDGQSCFRLDIDTGSD